MVTISYFATLVSYSHKLVTVRHNLTRLEFVEQHDRVLLGVVVEESLALGGSENSSMILMGPVVDVIKPHCNKLECFDAAFNFRPSLIISGEARSLPLGSPTRGLYSSNLQHCLQILI
jgi:hypothetical protein